MQLQKIEPRIQHIFAPVPLEGFPLLQQENGETDVGTRQLTNLQTLLSYAWHLF